MGTVSSKQLREPVTMNPLKQTQHITFQLNFAGFDLPIGTDEHGNEVVPLKPISDAFGLKWEEQRVKVNRAEWVNRLGICTPAIRGADQSRNMTCIRLDRVIAYLFQINSQKVRCSGNVNGADYLLQKQDEWADILFEYECFNGTISKAEHTKQQQNLRTFQELRHALKLKSSLKDEDSIQLTQKIIDKLSKQLGLNQQ